MRDGAPLIDVVGADLGVIARSRDYSLLALEKVKQALSRPPDQVSIHPESGMTRALYDCKHVPYYPSEKLMIDPLQIKPKTSIISSVHYRVLLLLGLRHKECIYASLFEERLSMKFLFRTNSVTTQVVGEVA